MNVYDNVINQMKKIRKIIELNNEEYDLLLQPKKIVQTSFSFKLDNGKVKRVNGFRVQHNDSRGPFKGGIRFHPNVDLGEVKSLAFWMSIKTSVLDLPLGGAKGGVEVNPRELSETELERLSKNYIKAIYEIIGVDKDIPAPDVYTSPKVMSWMLDEYEKIMGKHEQGMITGKPIELGGAKGREEATGLGGLFALDEAVKKYFPKKKPKQLTIAIQGFGNVGKFFALHAHKKGYKIVAVSDSKGAIFNKKGFNPEEVAKCKERNGAIAECYTKGSLVEHSENTLTNEELLELDVDILVPAALENQITKENAKDIKARVILELANGPTTPEADKILEENGQIVIPDVYANAGGVTVSYFEWVQNRQGIYWTVEEARTRLKDKMIDSFDKVYNTAQKYKTSLRNGAYIHAIKKILSAERLRGNL